MPKITVNGRDYACNARETVLDALTRHGVPIPFSCKSGLCQSCLMRAVEGTPGETAQKGLKETLQVQNYFLACTCVPDQDMVVELPQGAEQRLPAKVLSIDHLAPAVVRLRLERPGSLSYRPGQFINLYKDRSQGRSYSSPACRSPTTAWSCTSGSCATGGSATGSQRRCAPGTRKRRRAPFAWRIVPNTARCMAS